jgi:hypothetical protein
MIHSSDSGFKFPDGTVQTTAAMMPDTNYWKYDGSSVFYKEGSIGIGTEKPRAKVEVADGDIYISDINRGIIMKSPDGQCWRGTVDNFGNLVFAMVDCPDDIQNPTDLKSAKTTKKISIFPNPTDNSIIITFIDRNYENANAIIYTIDGKIVRKSKLSSDHSILNLNNIPSGSYVVKVHDKRGKELGNETLIKR